MFGASPARNYGSISMTINGSGTCSLIDPVKLHEVHQGIKYNKMFFSWMKSNSMNGMKILFQSLKWIILTVSSMMLFCRKYSKD
jgi:hypothetical protein